MSKLPESERCIYATRDGRRCRKGRMTDAVTLCYYHLEMEQKQSADAAAQSERHTAQAAAARDLLPNNAKLDSADAVSKFIARVTRYVAHGRIEPRVGNSLGYLGQLLLTTIAQRNQERAEHAAARAAANEHPLLGQYLPEVEKLIGFLGDAIAESRRDEEQASNQAVACDDAPEDPADDVEFASAESDPPAGGSQ